MNAASIAIAIVCLAVGVALGAGAVLALDDDSTVAATSAEPTPCETFHQASAFLAGSNFLSGAGLAIAVLEPQAADGERFSELTSMFDRCVEYARP